MLDARTLFHYYATGITSAMAATKSGTDSAYAVSARASQGATGQLAVVVLFLFVIVVGPAPTTTRKSQTGPPTGSAGRNSPCSIDAVISDNSGLAD